VLCNEKTKTIAEVYVDGELRFTFRRNFDDNMIQFWEDLISVVETLELKEGNDSLVWCYQSSGVYSAQSLYVIIKFGGGGGDLPCVCPCSVEHYGATKNSVVSLVALL
jgi:hypothetical protein